MSSGPSSPNPVPVVLCGRTTQIAHAVIVDLKPEYEVIHLILTLQAALSELPPLLRGSLPLSFSSSTGSGLDTRNYAKPPAAVLLGAGYDDAAVEEMREACGELKDGVFWLRPDTGKPAPPLGPEYGKALVRRIKDVLGGLREEKEGEEEGVKEGRGGVVWY